MRFLPSGWRRLLIAGLLVSPGLVRAQLQPCPKGPARIDIADGTYAPSPGVEFRLKHFHAELQPIGTTSPKCFEKVTVVSRAEIFVSSESLTRVFTEKLEQSESKIRDFQVQHDATGATLSGVIPKVIPVHFSLHGPVSTDGTMVKLHATSMKADGIPVKSLLNMVGEHLTNVLKLQGVSGVEAKEDELSFSPEKIAHLKGHILRAIPSDTGLTLVYGSARAAKAPGPFAVQSKAAPARLGSK